MVLVLTIVYVPSVNALLLKDFQNNSSMPESLQYTTLVLGTSAEVMGAIGMLKGKNWARLLYVFSVLAVLLFVLASPGIDKKRMIVPSAVYAVSTLFLFRPKANEYFRHPTL
jgi:hypothetical protein